MKKLVRTEGHRGMESKTQEISNYMNGILCKQYKKVNFVDFFCIVKYSQIRNLHVGLRVWSKSEKKNIKTKP